MEDQVNITVKFIKQFTKDWNDMRELFNTDKKNPESQRELFFILLNRWYKNELSVISHYGLYDREKARVQAKHDYEYYITRFDELGGVENDRGRESRLDKKD